MTRHLPLLLLFLIAAVVPMRLGAKDVEVSGEATYYDDGRHSRVECERLAAEQARVNALAKAFGTIVTQDIIQSDRVVDGRETNNFLALSATEVRGEWVADIGQPQFSYEHDANQNLIVTCKIKGRAHEISNEAVAFETAVLKNGVFRNNESSNFTDGDQMYLYFLGSSDGYLMVFLEDETRSVYNLLPYPHSTQKDVRVKKYEEYTFFSPERGKGQFGQEEELILTAEDYPEYNKLYVVYSPNPFSAPVMRSQGVLPEMKADDFTKWLLKTRRNDPKMGLKVINMEISPKTRLN